MKRSLQTLNPNKATGLDGIGPNILKLCGDSIVAPITFIINKCISEGVFPCTFKTASVIPLHKSGPKSDPNNYRPISILPTLSKIFERHIATQLMTFLTEHSLLINNQSGFRKSHSCCTALINLIEKWLKDVDEGKYVGAVFLDFKKAFDMVNHDVLFYKLELHHFSSSSLQLMKSYIYNRYQLVKIGDVQSDLQIIKSGVPQGSILGPMLFLLYINDIASFVDNTSIIDLYADDSTVHESGYDVKMIESHLQSSIEKIAFWCKINKMSINPLKLKCMILGSNHRLQHSPDLTLRVENHLIGNVSSQTVMGVKIDNNLKSPEHGAFSLL